DRGEEQAAVLHVVVPVAVDEDVAAGRPDVVGGDPHPARTVGDVVAGLPDELAGFLLVDVVAGDVGAVLAGGRRRRLGLGLGRRRPGLGGGRGGDDGDGAGVGGGPEAGPPLVPAVDLGPVTGHPLPAGRDRPPDAGDPGEVAALLVVGPVAGDPLHVVALGLVGGRHFLDGLGRGLGHHGAGRRPGGRRLGEGPVGLAAGLRLDAGPGRGVVGGADDGFLVKDAVVVGGRF